MADNVTHLGTHRGPKKPQTAGERIEELERLLRQERARADAYQEIAHRLMATWEDQPGRGGREGAPVNGVNR